MCEFMLTQSIKSLQDFVNYTHTHIKGNERSEAQSFLNAFFQAFDYDDAISAGAKFEQGVSKGSAKGNKGSADLVWADRVLIEMKSRGENLQKHYHQLERYWMRLTPKPKYSILCNFDEFWIYDFHNQVDTPVDQITIDELVHREGAFKFMRSATHAPIFRNNQVELTEKNAKRVGELYQALLERGRKQKFRDFDEDAIQRFILQCVLAMFAEDRGLLPKDMFISCVQDCKGQQSSSYDILGGLFQSMNTKGVTPGGRYQGVEYFNGGLFAKICPIELTSQEILMLENCASQRWDRVRPSIFGSIFESAIEATDKKHRHAHGMHFTSEADIRQIVIPTISEYWEHRIEEANTLKQLQGLHQQLRKYRVLDPACGSGNFLYVAYQELKQVEKLLLDKTVAVGGEDYLPIDGLVSPNQFYGMDTNLFAVQLARVTMMIARKIAIDTFGLTESALPLDTLDGNIVCQDALFTEWPQADAIIGNPPFLGGSKIRREFGDDYTNKLHRQFPDMRAQVDIASYWFRLAHDALDAKGRAGLVATNSISQGKSRSVSLDYIISNNGYIHNAVSTQPWSGEAAVHVSIINWSKEKPKQSFLDKIAVDKISSSLIQVSASDAEKLLCNLNSGFVGVQPNAKGFFIDENLASTWVNNNLADTQVIRRSISGSDLAEQPNGRPKRWIIDFADMGIEEASEFELPFLHVKIHVKPERDSNRETILREKWWRFKRTHTTMRKALIPLNVCFAAPRVSKWSIFLPVSTNLLPADSTTVIASDDFYILGILTSDVHRQWVKAQSSTLEDRTRYTHNTCFETFPFPQALSKSMIEEIRGTMQDLHEYRSEIMEKRGWGITKLYNEYFHEPASRLYKLHQQLDTLALKAYGFKASDDILEKLLSLNLDLAELEQNGQPVVGPWAPEVLSEVTQISGKRRKAA
jgi:hypothetical protein